MSESTMTITERGTKLWKNSSGELHRLDGPAIERSDGSKEWYQKGKLHRLAGPAVEWSDGTKQWYQHGECHRLDGPAIERADGTKKWLQNGQLHRLDGPAVEYKSGLSEWYYKNDLLGENLEGFWKLWDRLNDEERQNLNFHMWRVRLQNV